MKSRTRFLWIKLHTYFSCFFLPLAIMYLATGMLHMMDVDGGVRSEKQFEVTLPDGIPEAEEDVRAIMLPLMREKGQDMTLPADYYYEPKERYIGWYGYKGQVYFEPLAEPEKAILHIKKHDLWHQFLLIHKGHAGPIFWVVGLLFGLSLLFSLVSGLVIAIAVPMFRRTSIVFTLLGVVALTVGITLGV
ncbi:hypothetical protein ACONUD_12095 [Microbulbifer harenosus]|uniref:PepSY domain-containing protein n=1 Tax=Microbulbifer harenosus TaxID=2576840 RepID=A0ABY2UJM6_9GAMM|nr:hypothetical protein [Microbulbifer harenosus]TLM77206.1 hypothetical protein FDY93_09695 [Microbulbifer harenosus]